MISKKEAFVMLIKKPKLFFKKVKKKLFKKSVPSKEENYKNNISNKKDKKKDNSLLYKSIIKNNLLVSNVSLIDYEIAIYFAGGMGNIYQIEQWIEVLNELKKYKKVLFILRSKDVHNWMSENTDFTSVYCRTIEDLTETYENNNIKVVLYVNHAFKNFQSLINGRALHIHINHGESDKTSTITNQSKAYDYIFIVGQAAYDKYNLNLIRKDMSRFIGIGRPQLDYIKEISIGDSIEKNKKIILYAPTWEGTHLSMNFTSLDDYGVNIVNSLLNNPNYYLIYKPHPNTGSRVENTKKINEKILKMVKEHSNGKVLNNVDINSIYQHIDLAIFDNSAVAIDYLVQDKPMLMTDMFHRVKAKENKPTIVKAARMINENNSDRLLEIVEEEINVDTLKEKRNIIKDYFLGNYDYNKKESSRKFISSILEAVKVRDKLLEDLKELNNNVKTIVEDI